MANAGKLRNCLILFCWSLLVFPATLFASDTRSPDGKPQPHATVVGALITDLTRTIVAESRLPDSSNVCLDVVSGENGWIITQAATTALRALGHRVFIDSAGASCSIRCEIRPLTMNVRYGEAMHDGLFATAQVERTVSTSFAFHVTHLATKEVVTSKILDGARTDTVFVDALPALDIPPIGGMPAPARPRGSFLDKVVEPFVILGATGLAVFLFFHIRS